MGLAICGLFTPDALLSAVQQEDLAGLGRVKGLGRKTAQKTVGDL